MDMSRSPDARRAARPGWGKARSAAHGLFLLSAVVIVSGLPCSVSRAHDTIPTNWCRDPNSQIQIISTSVWTPEMLADFRLEVLTSPTPVDIGTVEDCQGNHTCGMVDDWHYANLAAKTVCTEVDGKMTASMQIQHFVLYPASFNSNNHHSDYQFGDGDLQVQCVVCLSGGDSGPGDPSGL